MSYLKITVCLIDKNAQLRYCNHMKVKLYPKLVTKNNSRPNKLYAFPFLGLIIRLVLLLPVGLWMMLLVFGYLFFWVTLPFYILFTGKYWNTAFTFIVGYLKLCVKITLFAFGLTDKYPGFRLNDGGLFKLEFEKPQKVNRLMAFPLLGFLLRIILLIPYLIFENVLSHGSYVAVFFSWFIVLFKGKYPESLYEFVHDYIRVSLASTAYITYMSDDYPSFSISMKHQTIKILLIIAGAVLAFSNFSQSSTTPSSQTNHTYNKNFEDIVAPSNH